MSDAPAVRAVAVGKRYPLLSKRGRLHTLKGALLPRNTRRSLPIALLRAREAVMTHFRPMLAAHELTWSKVVAQARVRAAAWWLVETDRPIAETGFLAGYSDQPHFTRDFGHRTGLAPGRYRELFARRR